MAIYVYSREGRVKTVTSDAGECYINAWYDFKELYGWQDFYDEQETEDDAFIEFCDDITTGVYAGEFEVTEWKI